MQPYAIVPHPLPSSVAPQASPRGGPRRVLLAEDDSEMRRLLAAVLRSDGYDVVDVGNGIDLMEQIELATWNARRETFDLIVSDVNMPDRSALEVLGGLQRWALRSPVILITAFEDAEMRCKARELGAVALLSKPLDLDAFCALLRTVCTGRTSPLGLQAPTGATLLGRPPAFRFGRQGH